MLGTPKTSTGNSQGLLTNRFGVSWMGLDTSARLCPEVFKTFTYFINAIVYFNIFSKAFSKQFAIFDLKFWTREGLNTNKYSRY